MQVVFALPACAVRGGNSESALLVLLAELVLRAQLVALRGHRAIRIRWEQDRMNTKFKVDQAYKRSMWTGAKPTCALVGGA